MNAQPTPRTDTVIFHRDNGVMRDHPFVVTADFARSLERDLTTLTEQRDRLAEALRLIADGTSCRECGGEDQALFARQALQSMICDALQSLTQNA